MTTELMRDLLSKDEKITVEYKTCQHGIQEDVYDTVCSFSNRYGGYIIMGVEDDGTPIGINPNLISVGPRWIFFTPRYKRARRTITAFCSYHAIL